ncbi:Bacterial regulatory proteins, tetR family [Roseovarius albus]|uniref:Bacterial regulatory proteins, tetR family n=1 Tax=Roseovarius albus TaxID=1247867 RepID=A0A1X6ZUR5_9RHOB|nr:TetR/AcrR family transcriptional regulator [Roseovarius albus]SLN62218.1 Bacterial regulatory proteins, tetR family [Roseovarius albus]
MTDTRTRILDLAEDFTQTKGFNNFSYLDLAAEIGVKNSSIHYHFKAKADLALALVERIRKTHGDACNAFNQRLETPQERLGALMDHFKGYVQNEKICMCGMMAAEFETVSPEVRTALALYFRDMREWLAEQFTQMNDPNPGDRALQFLSSLEGSVLLARLEADPAMINRALDGFVSR